MGSQTNACFSALQPQQLNPATLVGTLNRNYQQEEILQAHHLVQTAVLLIGLTGSAFAQPANPARPSSPSTTPPQAVQPAPGTPPSGATIATSPAANTAQ